MTREETQKILAVIASLYPNFNKQVGDGQLSATVDAWTWAFEEYTYGAISEALKAFIKINGSAFAPSAAELIAFTRKPQELNEMGSLEAWGLVSKAICRSTYYAEEEFDKLPETIQHAVGSPDQLRAWASTDASAIETVVASNFQKAYKTAAERERQRELLPQNMKTAEIIAKTLKQIEVGNK